MEINLKEMKETVPKMNKTKRWFFEKLKKKKWQAIFSQTPQEKKKEGRGEDKTQINIIKKGDIIRDKAEIQRIIRECNEQLYANNWTTWKKWNNS